MGVHALLCVWIVVLGCGHAQAESEFGARAIVKRPIVATNEEDPTASGTTLDLTRRVTLPRSLGDVVRESPGARVTNTGGMGASSTVSLRGADGDETLVLLNEIPLVTPDGGAFDLSVFPAELFERIEVYRGGAPVWLGSGAIGGVVRLIPRTAERTAGNVGTGIGSYRTWQLDGAAEVSESARIRGRSAVVLRGTRGDYPYVDDKGTRFDSSDDETRRRKNAQHAEASGYQDLEVRVGGGKLHLLALGNERSGGFPGPGSQPTPKIHRQSLRALVAAAFERKHGGTVQEPRARFQLTGSGAFGLDRFTDVFGQLGTSKQTETDDRSFQGFGRAAGSYRPVKYLEGTLIGSYGFDLYSPDNRFAYPQPALSTRHSVAGAAEVAFRGDLLGARFEIRPSARVLWSQAELHSTRTSGQLEFNQHVLAPTARVGSVLEPLRGIAFSASAATGTRLPSMFELSGDRGLVLPSPHLKPVRSTSYDGGVTLAGKAGTVFGTAEVRGFHQERRDSIAMFRTAQFQVGHENLSSVTQRGIELGGSGTFRELLAVHGSLTWLDTETALGKQLPFRPRRVAYVRPEATLRFADSAVSSASMSAEVWQRSFAFVDQPNLAYVPSCMKVALGAAVTLLGKRVRVAGRMDDVADARCTDLVGYPLPGRSLFFTITYQEALNEDAT